MTIRPSNIVVVTTRNCSDERQVCRSALRPRTTECFVWAHAFFARAAA